MKPDRPPGHFSAPLEPLSTEKRPANGRRAVCGRSKRRTMMRSSWNNDDKSFGTLLLLLSSPLRSIETRPDQQSKEKASGFDLNPTARGLAQIADRINRIRQINLSKHLPLNNSYIQASYTPRQHRQEEAFPSLLSLAFIIHFLLHSCPSVSIATSAMSTTGEDLQALLQVYRLALCKAIQTLWLHLSQTAFSPYFPSTARW